MIDYKNVWMGIMCIYMYKFEELKHVDEMYEYQYSCLLISI